MRFPLKQYLATLLTLILVAQAPVAMALSCVSAPMEARNVAGDSGGDIGEEKCREMPGTTFCQSDSCCVTFAAAIVDVPIVNHVLQIESSPQEFANRLTSTYLASNTRPPIN